MREIKRQTKLVKLVFKPTVLTVYLVHMNVELPLTKSIIPETSAGSHFSTLLAVRRNEHIKSTTSGYVG